MISYLEYLGVPWKVGLIVIGGFATMQAIGEFLEFKGKVVPEFLKIRKFFSRKSKEKEETTQTLREVKDLLNDYYSTDNITKRNSWMEWVNESVVEVSKNLADVTEALKDNTRLTEEMFIQSSRDRVIDFATKVADEKVPVSREEFNRIFKVYDKYEEFLADHKMKNGEIDIAYRIVEEAYAKHMRNHSFIEDVRGYTPGEQAK